MTVLTTLTAKTVVPHNTSLQPNQSQQIKPLPTKAININTASIAELESLKHIGAKKAAAIVAYRKQHGGFTSIDALSKVKGISQGIVDANAKRLKAT